MGGWVDGHFDIFFDILLKPPQPFTGLFFIPINCNLVEMFITLYMPIKPRYTSPCGILQKSEVILYICKSDPLETKMLVVRVT